MKLFILIDGTEQNTVYPTSSYLAKDSQWKKKQTNLWKFPLSIYFQLHGMSVHSYWVGMSAFQYKWRNNKNEQQEQASSGQQWTLLLVTKQGGGILKSIWKSMYCDAMFEVSAAMCMTYLFFCYMMFGYRHSDSTAQSQYIRNQTPWDSASHPQTMKYSTALLWKSQNSPYEISWDVYINLTISAQFSIFNCIKYMNEHFSLNGPNSVHTYICCFLSLVCIFIILAHIWKFFMRCCLCLLNETSVFIQFMMTQLYANCWYLHWITNKKNHSF